MAQARRGRRTVRKLDVKTVLRVSALLYTALLIVTLVALTILWFIARATGVVDGFEDFIQDGIVLTSFRFLGAQAFVGVLLMGLIGVVISTGMTTMAAIFYNQISDVVGGIRFTVDEDEPPSPA